MRRPKEPSRFGNWSLKAAEPIQQVQSHGEEVLPTSAESLPEVKTLAASQDPPAPVEQLRWMINSDLAAITNLQLL